MTIVVNVKSPATGSHPLESSSNIRYGYSPMITILLNGQALSLPEECSLERLLNTQGQNAGYFAVAVNKTFISKTQYASTLLQEGAEVEVLAPMQGG